MREKEEELKHKEVCDYLRGYSLSVLICKVSILLKAYYCRRNSAEKQRNCALNRNRFDVKKRLCTDISKKRKNPSIVQPSTATGR